MSKATEDKILATIAKFWKEHGYGPQFREVTEAMGFRSTNTTRLYLNKLRAKNLVTWEAFKSRTLRLTSADIHHRR